MSKPDRYIHCKLCGLKLSVIHFDQVKRLIHVKGAPIKYSQTCNDCKRKPNSKELKTIAKVLYLYMSLKDNSILNIAKESQCSVAITRTIITKYLDNSKPINVVFYESTKDN
jgi:hypothetical protein